MLRRYHSALSRVRATVPRGLQWFLLTLGCSGAEETQTSDADASTTETSAGDSSTGREGSTTAETGPSSSTGGTSSGGTGTSAAPSDESSSSGGDVCGADPRSTCTSRVDCSIEAFSCGEIASWWDSEGCLRAECSEAGECPTGHTCWRSWECDECVPPITTCVESMAGGCACDGDGTCSSAICIPEELRAGADCPGG